MYSLDLFNKYLFVDKHMPNVNEIINKYKQYSFLSLESWLSGGWRPKKKYKNELKSYRPLDNKGIVGNKIAEAG